MQILNRSTRTLRMVHWIFALFAVSLMGWVDAMGPEVDRIGEFLRRVTRAG